METSAPRLPKRSVSESSDLQAALESTGRGGGGGDRGDMAMSSSGRDDVSLGDFKQYQQQRHTNKGSLGMLSKNSNLQKMGNIPEESLGSFAAFAKKYEQEELLGLHDDPGLPSPTKQQQQQQACQDENSVSLGGIMNPMAQYGGGTTNKPSLPVVEESLGSFALFAEKYEEDKLLGLNDSEATEPPIPVATKQQKEVDTIPEESMDIGMIMGGGGGSGSGGHQEKAAVEESLLSPTKRKSRPSLPASRIHKLGKRGGIGYKIMVDTPGGHWAERMKIVVAIELEDETDSEEEKEEEQDSPAPPKKSRMKEIPEEDNEMDTSGKLPTSAQSVEDPQVEKPQKKKKQRKKPNDKAAKPKQKMRSWHDKDKSEEEESDGDNDDINPEPSGRWKSPRVADNKLTLRQPEREKSRSTHTTMSNLTMDSAIESGPQIVVDRGPSNPAFQRKPPEREYNDLRRPSGAIQRGGTASLLKQTLAPHNLGTRRGLLLRQQSEASMKSHITSKSGHSNDSSVWVSPDDEAPEGYQASFMQLNLLDLEKTQMQTNEEVEKADVPEGISSGGGSLLPALGEEEEEEAPEVIAEGKAPEVAATELLGMKTMLKHIKRAAPKRTKSFDEMPKQMWNTLFARKNKSELPGSQYVDNDDSTSQDEDEGGRDNNNNQNGDEPATAEEVENQATASSGIVKTLMRVTSAGMPASSSNDQEKSASKGKSSLWMTSAIKRVIAPGKSSNQSQENVTDENDGKADTANDNDDDDDKSLDAGDIFGGEEEDEGEDAEEEAPNTDQPVRPRRRQRAGEGSTRGARSTDGTEGSTRGARSTMRESANKGGPARLRVADRSRQMHNRSMTSALDYYSAEHSEDGPPQEGGDGVDESRRRPRVRPRRQVPNRTRSQENYGGRAMPSRTKSSEGLRGMAPSRTKSQDASPVRAPRDAAKKLNASFSGVDPGDLPSRTKPEKSPRLTPGKTKSGVRGSIRKERPRRKPQSPDEADADAAAAGAFGATLPEKATDEEIRELLDYH